jgi:ABC-type nitrate/sulfonate/bicarbonate transport system permease component
MAVTDKFGRFEVSVPGATARLIGLLLGLVGWWVLATRFPNELMPFPLETLALTGELVRSGVVFPHLAATLWRTLWGFVGSVLIGGTLGVLMGSNRYGRRFVLPYIVAGISVPAIAWAAISTLIFGFSELTPIVATVAVTFPFVAINVWKGVENIDADLVAMSSAFGVSNVRMLWRLILPNAAPQLFAGARFGLAISWKIVTIAEIFASSSGIGYKLIQAYSRYQFEMAWAWAVVFMIVILLIEYAIFRPLERKVYEYRPEADFNVIV